MWRPPTLADEGAAPTAVRCGCGRRTTADMLVRTPTSAGRHVCDACRQRDLRAGRFSRVELLEMHGAPNGAISRARRADEHAARRGRPR